MKPASNAVNSASSMTAGSPFIRRSRCSESERPTCSSHQVWSGAMKVAKRSVSCGVTTSGCDPSSDWSQVVPLRRCSDQEHDPRPVRVPDRHIGGGIRRHRDRRPDSLGGRSAGPSVSGGE